MRRFRTQWLALFGALVILSLSLSSAFGARPAAGTDDATNVGQQVSTFVHVLLNGFSDEDEGGDEDQDEDTDDSEECQPASDEDGAEEGTDDDGSADDDTGDETGDDTGDEESPADDCDEQADEDTDEDSDEDADSDGDSSAPTAENHGQCVAEVAHSDAVGENDTHGWAVALAAQITCWFELNGDESADDGDEDTGADEDAGTDETSEASSTGHGKSEAAHQQKLDRGTGKPAWAATKTHGGNGKGHGHNH
jgi:hypothetical protein